MPQVNLSPTAVEAIVTALQASLATTSVALNELRAALTEDQRQEQLRQKALELAHRHRANAGESHIDMPHVDPSAPT